MGTAEKEKKTVRRLSNAEQETIICFDKESKTASIFTYEKTWQKHLEKKLGLKPVKDNGFGGREYLIGKDRISMPRARVQLSQDEKTRRSEQLSKIRSQQKAML